MARKFWPKTEGAPKRKELKQSACDPFLCRLPRSYSWRKQKQVTWSNQHDDMLITDLFDNRLMIFSKRGILIYGMQ